MQLECGDYYDYGFEPDNLVFNEFKTFFFDKTKQTEARFITVGLQVSEWSLVKLKKIASKIKTYQRPDEIDIELITRSYYGHTLFGIF